MWSAGSTDLFSNREISLLIELVEALPVLYAADKKLYKSTLPREKAWKVISEKLNRTVSECEKKWRYLRDKYVKERRRLIDESKMTGKEVKSNWQHYESMEFLATHLRLPGNGVQRANTAILDDEDSQRYSEGSPQMNSLISPPSTVNESNITKQEPSTRSHNMATWPTTSDQERHFSRVPDTTESFQTASLIPPPTYPSLFGRTAAANFTHHPLWAMWANGLQQANQHINNTQRYHNLNQASNSSPTSEHASHNDTDGEPKEKKRKLTKDSQHININVSLKDLQPADKYSEYHFCISLAQMMETVPPNQRPELKIKLIQLITGTSQSNLSEVPSSS